MRIWIDLANSPHVLFFRPMIRYLEQNDHEVIVTIRPYAQTVGLAQRFALGGEVVEVEERSGAIGKARTVWDRSSKLMAYLYDKKVDLAIGHNSYSQVLAAKRLGLRTVTLMDYEGQPANHLAFRLADKVIVPDFFPDKSLKRFGATPEKVYKYRGFKEQLYLTEFVPDPTFGRDLEAACQGSRIFDSKTVIITVRTPAREAMYHRFDNPLFDRLLNKLNTTAEATTIVIPRSDIQRERIVRSYPALKIPSEPLDGMNLVYYSDFVISAGGTMNREAAIMGTRAISIFAGAVPSVDTALIELGRMVHVRTAEQLERLDLTTRTSLGRLGNYDLLGDLVREILN